MTGRERIVSAINHKESDKLPIDCGSMKSTGIMAMTYNSLKKHLNITEGSTKIYDAAQQLAIPEDWYLDMFQIDSVDISRTFSDRPEDWNRWTLPDSSEALLPSWFNVIKDKDGFVCVDKDQDELARMPEGVAYFSQTLYPYYGLEKEDFSDLEHAIGKTMWGHFGDPMWKDAGQEDFYKRLSSHAKALHENTEYASMIGFGGNFFEMGQFLYRTDEFLMKLLTSPKEMNMLLDALAEQYLENLEKVISAVSGYVDVIQFGDDFGTQATLMISPDVYREMIYPRQKKLFSYVHDNSDMKVFLHSCGAIHSILPDLIDVGVDIINPVQIGAAGMDPINLKREYGKDIVFWGGGIDTQHILSSGTVQEVQKNVQHNCESLMKDGGFVFSQVHNIVQGVPPENIVAMYNAANSIRY